MRLRQDSHLETEHLSAYLDRELPLVEARAVEAHLAGCASCRQRHQELAGVVARLGQVERPAPPPWLGAQIRHHLAAPKPSLWQRLVRPLLPLTLRSPIGSTLSMACAVALVVLVPGWGGHGEHRGLPGFAAYPGPVAYPSDDPNFQPIPATIEVAGRIFLLHEDDDVWVEEGLVSFQPEARITPSSPQGRALLARYEDLGYLLRDGSRVVMRYQRETLELWSGV